MCTGMWGCDMRKVSDIEEQRKKANIMIGVIVGVFLVIAGGLCMVLMGLINGSNGDVAEGDGTGGEDLSGLYAENPILKSLPLEVDYYNDDYTERVRYTITYRLINNNTDFVIMVKDYTGGNYGAAVDKLKAQGYEVDEGKVEYADLTGESEGGKAF